jgi:hypothetical protein
MLARMKHLAQENEPLHGVAMLHKLEALRDGCVKLRSSYRAWCMRSHLYDNACQLHVDTLCNSFYSVHESLQQRVNFRELLRPNSYYLNVIYV